MFAPSPFEPLEEHVKLVRQCSDLFREMVVAYLDKDFETSDKLALKISELEHEADKIKNRIRESLPRSIFMPVDRGDFLNYLREQDQVADRLEEVALTMSLRRTVIPEELRDDFLDLAKKVCDVVDLVPLAVRSMIELLEATFRKKDSKVNLYINLLNEKEQLTDDLDLKIRKHIFDIEDKLTHGELFHLMRVVKLLARVADHAENCGDRMRVMVARL
jgi:hypothetical protein